MKIKQGDKVRVVGLTSGVPEYTMGWEGVVINNDGCVRFPSGEWWTYGDDELRLVSEEVAPQEPELAALSAVVKELTALDADAQRRVVSYLADRFDVMI